MFFLLFFLRTQTFTVPQQIRDKFRFFRNTLNPHLIQLQRPSFKNEDYRIKRAEVASRNINLLPAREYPGLVSAHTPLQNIVINPSMPYVSQQLPAYYPQYLTPPYENPTFKSEILPPSPFYTIKQESKPTLPPQQPPQKSNINPPVQQSRPISNPSGKGGLSYNIYPPPYKTPRFPYFSQPRVQTMYLQPIIQKVVDPESTQLLQNALKIQRDLTMKYNDRFLRPKFDSVEDEIVSDALDRFNKFDVNPYLSRKHYRSRPSFSTKKSSTGHDRKKHRLMTKFLKDYLKAKHTTTLMKNRKNKDKVVFLSDLIKNNSI